MLALPTENTVISCGSVLQDCRLDTAVVSGPSRHAAAATRAGCFGPVRRRECMDLGIRGRRAIVTGGGSGIGYETAREFLQEGVRVAICGRNKAKLHMAREQLAQKTGGEIHTVQADMTNEADIVRLVDTATAKLGGVDILVNNAGTMYSGRFAALTDESLKHQLETKLFGFMRAIRLVYPMMQAQKWGRIVNMIGGAGKEPDPYMFGSGMTKAAL